MIVAPGFLVEALVEAIPQCSLQVAAVVLASDASALNVFSILLSLAVIASKGWLAAYSLHRPTFVFNSLAIAADVRSALPSPCPSRLASLSLGRQSRTLTTYHPTRSANPPSVPTLTSANSHPCQPSPVPTLALLLAVQVACLFATASWLALWLFDLLPAVLGSAALEVSSMSATDEMAVRVSLFWLRLVALGIGFGTLSSGGIVLFSMCDDHLKARDPSPETGIAVDSVAFNIYTLRTAAWLLSLLPSITLMLLLRLAYLPLLAFRSLSSEHATHHAFFVSLFRFLRGEDAAAAADGAITAREGPDREAPRWLPPTNDAATSLEPAVVSRLAQRYGEGRQAGASATTAPREAAPRELAVAAAIRRGQSQLCQWWRAGSRSGISARGVAGDGAMTPTELELAAGHGPTAAAPAEAPVEAPAAAPAGAPAGAGAAGASAGAGAAEAPPAGARWAGAPAAGPDTTTAKSEPPAVLGARLEHRLLVANSLIQHAHCDARELRARLAELPANSSPARTETITRAWVRALGRPRQSVIGRPTAALPAAPEPAPAEASPGVLATWQEPPPPVARTGRWGRRWALFRYAMRRRWLHLMRELACRSEVFRRLTGARSDTRSRGMEAGLMAVALTGLTLSLCAALPFALLLLVLLPLGAVFPVVHLVLSVAGRAPEPLGGSFQPTVSATVNATVHSALNATILNATMLNATALDATELLGVTSGRLRLELLLPWVLTAIYLALVLLLLLLLPVVHRFQALRSDLLPTSGLPAAFFSPLTVGEMRRRFELSVAATTAAWDHECCVCMGPIEPHDAVYLHGCAHVFHHECITAWLRERSTCPLCRSAASAGEMSAYCDLIEFAP